MLQRRGRKQLYALLSADGDGGGDADGENHTGNHGPLHNIRRKLTATEMFSRPRGVKRKKNQDGTFATGSRRQLGDEFRALPDEEQQRYQDQSELTAGIAKANKTRIKQHAENHTDNLTKQQGSLCCWVP